MDLSVVRKSPSPRSESLSHDEISVGGEDSPLDPQSRSTSPSSSEGAEPVLGAGSPRIDSSGKDPQHTFNGFLDALNAHRVTPGAPFGTLGEQYRHAFSRHSISLEIEDCVSCRTLNYTRLFA